MVESIVQLSHKEYEELVNKAKKNKGQVLEEARRMWEEEGIAELIVTFTGNNSNTINKLSIDCYSELFFKRGKFNVSNRFKSRLNNLLDKNIKETMCRYYGHPMEIINKCNAKVRSMKIWTGVSVVLMAIGWMVAFGLLLEVL